MNRIIILLIFIVALTACQEHPLQQLGLTSVSQKMDSYVLEGGGTAVVDILFVVDNSGSMAEEQLKVAKNIENFMAKIKESGDKTDYHIGVITISIWQETYQGIDSRLKIKDIEDGRLQLIVTQNPGDPGTANFNQSICDNSRHESKRYLTNADSANVIEYLSNTIKCVGTQGAIIERGFDAIERALTEPRLSGENVGFLRENAKLMIIVISDEEDCSTGNAQGDLPIHFQRAFDCSEQYGTNVANYVVSDPSELKQNKVKTLTYYRDFLVTLKGNPLKVGFAAIVGPHNCWTGSIDDMGVPIANENIPNPQLNCGYTNEVIEDSLFSQHFGACTNNAIPACSCSSGGEDQCNVGADLFTTCFNDISGTANKLQFVDTTNPCSETHLNGTCPNNETHHCEVTSSGVKCVQNTCSNTDVNGTCKAGYYCNGGTCMQKEEISYSAKKSYATAGKRYLEFYDLLKTAQAKDTYKYPICLEDFGSPLSLIGAKLADAKCEYNLQSKTDDPCNLVIKIFTNKDEPNETMTETSLNNPWTFTTLADYPEKTASELQRICKENAEKPYSERDDITRYLEKVPCKGVTDKQECLKILFTESGSCPQPGSAVEIYYGVIQ